MTRRRSSSKSRTQSHAFTDAKRGERLQKVLATAGVASRRACEQLIEDGAVTVNGQLVQSLPAWVDPVKDRIEVDGQPVKRVREAKKSRAADHVYVLLHKPRNVISTTKDELGRRHVTDLVELPVLTPGEAQPRLFPVGRLDAESTGLILLTNDGDLAHQLTHPSYEVPKEYHVSVRGRVDEEALEQLRAGLMLAHRGTKGRSSQVKRAKAVEVRILGYKHDEVGDRTILSVTLREGQNREIRRLMAKLGYKVRRLKRVALGPIRLKGLGAGRWRPLTPVEIKALKRTVKKAGK
ncbi:MAG: pseudouridine synthase [Phycisphaeraceae bacterium]